MNKYVLMTEIHDSTKYGENGYLLRELVVNSEQVVMLREDPVFKAKVMAKGWPNGLDERVSFCKLTINSGSGHTTNVFVVGNIMTITENLQSR